MDRREVDRLLGLAATQHALVSTGQAAGLGISPAMLRWAVARGWLRIVRRGVYAVVGMPPSRWQPIMAAALAAGPNAVISHRSAASIHRFHGVLAGAPDLTLPERYRGDLDGVRIHRARGLERLDLESRHGVRLTAPIRTVIDLAPAIEDHLLGEILDEGAIARLWTAEQVRDRLAALGTRGRPGSRRLQRLLALRMGEATPGSRLEQHVWRVLRQDPAVPHFETHYVVYIHGERFELDTAWPAEKIDGEVDGLATRGSRTKFERQCRRENLLAAHGWRIAHLTAHMDDATLAAQIIQFLRAA